MRHAIFSVRVAMHDFYIYTDVIYNCEMPRTKKQQEKHLKQLTLCNQSRFKIGEVASNKHKLISNIPQTVGNDSIHQSILLYTVDHSLNMDVHSSYLFGLQNVVRCELLLSSTKWWDVQTNTKSTQKVLYLKPFICHYTVTTLQ